MKALLLCALLFFCPFGSAAPSASPPATLKLRALSEQDIASIRTIASRYPCAMLTLLHIMRGADTPERGTLYIDEIPDPATVAAVLDDLRMGSFDALYLALQVNLYSSAPTYTELRWSTSQVDGETWQLNFRAELRERTGPPLTPRHILEQAVQITIAPDGLRLRESPRLDPSPFAPITKDL